MNDTAQDFIRKGGPSKKKQPYPVSPTFLGYLVEHERAVSLPIKYNDLMRYTTEIPLIDKNGVDTLWKTVFYSDIETDEIYDALRKIYAYLQADGDMEVLAMEHLSVARVDYCSFGNTHPFRVRIINHYNDNYDHFYVKKADASRLYGLELEELLSPNRIRYLVDGNTLIEEHIAGIPGDVFIEDNLNESSFHQIRIAKEFIKFNERCLVRLLGDMRSYNFVVDITPDFEAKQFRIRAIDFDQQSYEGTKNMYLPQFFKENRELVKLVMKHMNMNTVKQYKLEERNLIATRARSSKYRLSELLGIMKKDVISTDEKIFQLRKELYYHYHQDEFLNCSSMGEIVETSIDILKTTFELHAFKS